MPLPRVGRAISVLALAALSLQAVSETAANVVDFDLWHEMALAREIVSSGRVPKVDPFAYTPTLRPFVHHEWGAGMVGYALAESFGPAGILALKYALLAAILAVALTCAARRGGPIEEWGYLAVPAVLLLAGGCLPVRAQMYSYLFTAALLLLLQFDEDGHRSWIVPWLIAFPVWANLHGGCAVGIVLVAVCAGERMLRRRPSRHLWITAAVMAGLLAVNVYGTAYYGYLWRALSMPRPQITEWQPAWTLPGLVAAAFWVCVALLAYAGAASRFASTPGIAMLLCLGVEAFWHVKLVPLFGVAWLCYVPGYLRKTRAGQLLSGFQRDWRPLAVGLWLLVAILSVYGFTAPDRTWKLRVPGDSDVRAGGITYPVAAVEFLQARRFRGNLMTPYAVGAYVTWQAYPAIRVSLDSRFEVAYPPGTLDESMSFYAARPGWQNVLRKYSTDAVLVPAASPVAGQMPGTGWGRSYSDARFAIYVRPGLAIAPMTRSRPLPDGTIP